MPGPMAAPAVPPAVADQLREARSLLELTTLLGKVCIDLRPELRKLVADPDAAVIREELEARVRWLDEKKQIATGSDGTFAYLLDVDAFEEKVELAETYPPIGHLAILHGLLRPLGRFYEEITGVVELVEGTPVPIASRGVNTLFRTTPVQGGTSGQLRLLQGTGFYLFQFGADGEVPVQLDFSIRERLDELTWAHAGRLPLIATIHPRVGKDGVRILEEDPVRNTFFGVAPVEWDPRSVLDQLRSAASAGAVIAILPELCLSESELENFEDELRQAASELPPLVVNGSAHIKNGPSIRANEARIYLDGRRVGRHRKINPYNLRKLPDGRTLPQTLREDLTDEIKPITVFSGVHTRMAVVICSDLIDEKLAVQLQDAGVNLLLVPALTPEPGSFNGDICTLASHCQGVSVIANVDTSLYPRSRPSPFMVMAAVPRPRIGEQSREYRRRRGGPAVALFDPNRRLRSALRWL